MRILTGAIIGALLASASPAAAQSAYKCYNRDGSVWYSNVACPLPSPYGTDLLKCVSPKGQVSIQQEPCAKGWRLVSVRSGAPEAPPTAEQLQRRAYQQRKAQADSQYLSSLAGSNRRGSAQGHSIPVPGQGGGQCANAKAERDRVLNIVGLRRTYDLLRALDEQVYNACK